MPKISEYEIVNPEGDDKIIVSKTDGTPTDVTKNITVDALATYISPGGGYFGVTKLNTLKGELTIEGGTNVLVATDFQNKKITIAAPGVGETYLFFSQTNTTTPENVDLVLQDSQQNESIVTLVAGTNIVLQNTGAEIQISSNIPSDYLQKITDTTDLIKLGDISNVSEGLYISIDDSNGQIDLNGAVSFSDQVLFPNNSEIIISDELEIMDFNKITFSGVAIDFDNTGQFIFGDPSLQNGFLKTDVNGNLSAVSAPADTTYDLTSVQSGTDVDVNLTGSDAITDTVKLVAGTNITLADNGSSEVTINATGSDTTYDLASAQSGDDVNVTLTGSDTTTDTVKLVAGANVSLTDNGSSEVTINADDSVTTLNGLNGVVSIINGTNISVDVLNPSNEIQINNTLSISDLISNSSDTYTSVPEVVQVVTLTTTQYNNLVTKVPTTLYILVDPLP